MDYDIAIIGAGPAGLSFACSLRDSGLNIAVIEKQPRDQLANPAIDGRDIALTHLSRKILQQQGIWQRIPEEQVSPLERAEVVDGDSPHTLNFTTPHVDDEALGFLVANHQIRQAIYEEFARLPHITLIDNCEVSHVHTSETAGYLDLADGRSLKVDLIVAADTRFSASRRQMGISSDAHDFGRTAILCRMQHERDHQHTAFECFHYGRTLAILPMPGKTASIVITAPSDQTDEILAMSEYAFNQDIEKRLHGRLGAMKQLGKRFSYPLVGVHANRFTAQRYVLIGDAAVGMHPVTAHGFNLGLSGQDLLAGEILQALNHGQAFWQRSVLTRYQREHMLSTRPLYHGTNAIVGLFTNDRFPATLLRKAVLQVSDRFPPLKWAIQQKLMTKNHLHTLIPPLFVK